MTDAAPETTRGLSRRTLLRNGLVTGLGAAAATVAIPALTGVAEAVVLDSATPPGGGSTVSFDAQPNWWWCVLCHALFASDSNGSANGVCPYGNANNGYTRHSSSLNGVSSWQYNVPYGNPAHTNLQSQWNWCNWCAVLWYSGSNNNGADYCAYNTTVTGQGFTVGPHNPGTWNYDVPYGGWTGDGPFLQGNWMWCGQCGELWHNDGSSPSFCPLALGAGPHAAGTRNYQLFTPQTR